MPMLSGWFAGKHPMPSSVTVTGASINSANARSSFIALLWMTPWPARISGLRAALIISIALVISALAGSRCAR